MSENDVQFFMEGGMGGGQISFARIELNTPRTPSGIKNVQKKMFVLWRYFPRNRFTAPL